MHPAPLADNELLTNPISDGHNDFAIFIRYMYNNHIYQENFTEPFENGGLPMHVDLPRLREGLNGGAFWSVYTPCPANGTDWSDENYAPSSSFSCPALLASVLG